MRRLSWLALLVCLGCGANERGPSLVELSELSPRHVEVGDRLRLTGSGFPEGRPAQLSLRGEVRRAGEAPLERVTVSTDAELVAPHALEASVTPELAAALWGGADPRHATFRGDIEVSFSPQTKSGLPVSGHLDGVTLDLAPGLREVPNLRALRAEGARFSRFVGASLAVGASGVQVTALAPKSRASRAGVMPGDFVQELDGMVLRGVEDFIPPPNTKSSLWVVRRGPDTLALRVDSSGFRYSSPETLRTALTLLGVLSGLFFLLFSPLGRVIEGFERKLAARIREVNAASGAASASVFSFKLLRALLAEQLPSSFLPYLAVVGTSALAALITLGKSVILAELDLVVVPAATLSALAASAFISGGSATRWSLRGALAQTLCALLLNVPLAGLIATCASAAGSLRPLDVVAAQGPFPWQWAAFRTPSAFVLSALALGALVPTLALRAEKGSRCLRQRSLALLSSVHALCTATVLALLAFGGHALPAPTTSVWQWLGVALTLAKVTGILGSVALFRWAVGTIETAGAWRSVLLLAGLPSVLALAGALVGARLAPGTVLATLASVAPSVLCWTAALTTLWTLVGVARSARVPANDLRVKAWL